MTEIRYHFSLIRYIHNNTTGDAINIGVAAWSLDENPRSVYVRIRRDAALLHALRDLLDTDLDATRLKSLESEIRNLIATSPDVGAAIGSFTDNSSGLDMTPAKPGFTMNMEERFETLMRIYAPPFSR